MIGSFLHLLPRPRPSPSPPFQPSCLSLDLAQRMPVHSLAVCPLAGHANGHPTMRDRKTIRDRQWIFQMLVLNGLVWGLALIGLLTIAEMIWL